MNQASPKFIIDNPRANKEPVPMKANKFIIPRIKLSAIKNTIMLYTYLLLSFPLKSYFLLFKQLKISKLVVTAVFFTSIDVLLNRKILPIINLGLETFIPYSPGF